MTDIVDDAEKALEKWRDTLEGEARSCFKASRDALGTSPRALCAAAISDVFYSKSRRVDKKAQRLAKQVAQKSRKDLDKEVK